MIAVERFGTIEQALKVAQQVDLLLLDRPPHYTAGTPKIAQASDLVILPTELSLDDLQPSVLLAHELIKKGIRRNKIAFVLCRVGESEAEISEARRYIIEAGYRPLSGSIPERIAYRRASDAGRAVTETRFPSLNQRSDELVQSIINLASKLERAA